MDLQFKGYAYFKLLIYIIKSQETIRFGNQINTKTILYFTKHNNPFLRLWKLHPLYLHGWCHLFFLDFAEISPYQRGLGASPIQNHMCPSLSTSLLQRCFPQLRLAPLTAFMFLSLSSQIQWEQGLGLFCSSYIPMSSPCPAQRKYSVGRHFMHQWLRVDTSSFKLRVMIILRAS